MSASTVDLDRTRPVTARLVGSELLKIRSTNAWWWFALSVLAWTLIALAFNTYYAYQTLQDPEAFGGVGAMVTPEFHAGNVYTSGQYLGLMFVMLLGILMVTNEFHHQTATATFLTTPHRTVVIIHKLITGVAVGLGFGIITTVIALPVGAIFFEFQGVGSMLGEGSVQRAILLNLLAYGVWAILGIAIGTLITNQLAATITAAALYLIGTQVASLVFLLLAMWLDNETILEWQVVVPSIASQVMTMDGEGIPGAPAWWIGALILLGYAILAGTLGVLITRKRDIS